MKTGKFFKTLGTIIGYIVIFMMAAALVLIVRGNIKGEVTFIGGQAIMWVKTPSMEPKIPAQSYIVVETTRPEDVRVNNIIVFKSEDPELGGAYNTHRVIEVIGDHEEFVTKGDNNVLPDKYTVKAENIVGKYKRNLPIISVFGRLMQNPMGVIITVTVIFAIILLMYVPDMRKATKERSAIIEKNRRDKIDELVKLEVEKLRAADGKKAEKESGDGEKTEAAAEETAVGASEKEAQTSEEKTAETSEDPKKKEDPGTEPET